MHENKYETTLLYDQSYLVDDGMMLHASTYSVSYLYPQATAPTCMRIRVSCLFAPETNNEPFLPLLGISEKWTSDGWSLIEEFRDTRRTVSSPEELRDIVLAITKSFTLGVPIENDIDLESSEDKMEVAANPNEPILRVVKFDENEGK